MKIIITAGDTNGIGPEISLRTLEVAQNEKGNDSYILIIPQNVFNHYYSLLDCSFKFSIMKAGELSSTSKIAVYPLKNVKMNIGRPTKESGAASISILKKARDFINFNKESVLVTAPISKEAVKSAGGKFPGHTELLASWEKSKSFMMFFISSKLKGGILTIHIPLKEVSQKLISIDINDRISLVKRSLLSDFNIPKPNIALLGVNPHAGENGVIGNEEKKIFANPIRINKIDGPFAADGFFAAKQYNDYDFILSGYHDQFLIPFKMLSWKDGVNYTAGLSLIRTSPDHGTAFDIAGKGIAEFSSMAAAVKLAKKIFVNRRKYSLEKT